MIFSKTQMFVFVMMFWLGVWGLFQLAGFALVVPDGAQDNGSIDPFASGGSGLDLMLRTMFFQLPEDYAVPFFIPMILDMIAAFSVYVVVTTILGVIFPAD